MRRPVVVVAACISLAVIAPVIWISVGSHQRAVQFAAAQEFVRSHGGSLSLDLVDGNYMLVLDGDAATDEAIAKMVPKLRALPTGFTFVGPGESRLFMVVIANSPMTDEGLREVCQLRLHWLCIQGSPISDPSLSLLAGEGDLVGIVIAQTGLTEDAIENFRRSHPKIDLLVDDRR